MCCTNNNTVYSVVFFCHCILLRFACAYIWSQFELILCKRWGERCSHAALYIVVPKRPPHRSGDDEEVKHCDKVTQINALKTSTHVVVSVPHKHHVARVSDISKRLTTEEHVAHLKCVFLSRASKLLVRFVNIITCHFLTR